MEDPYTATSAWHLLIMLVASFVTHCREMASYSSTTILHNSGSVVVLATLAQRACPNWSHKFCEIKIRSASRSFHLLNSQILEVVSNKTHSVEASARIFEYRVQCRRCGSATGCRISSSYLYAFRLLPKITNLVFLVMEMLHQTIKSCYCICVAISAAFSVSSPHFDPTI